MRGNMHHEEQRKEDRQMIAAQHKQGSGVAALLYGGESVQTGDDKQLSEAIKYSSMPVRNLQAELAAQANANRPDSRKGSSMGGRGQSRIGSRVGSRAAMNRGATESPKA